MYIYTKTNLFGSAVCALSLSPSIPLTCKMSKTPLFVKRELTNLLLSGLLLLLLLLLVSILATRCFGP